MTEQFYTATDAAVAAGVNPHTLRSWLQREVIKLNDKEKAVTNGASHRFTQATVLRIANAAALTELGVSPTLASLLANEIERQTPPPRNVKGLTLIAVARPTDLHVRVITLENGAALSPAGVFDNAHPDEAQRAAIVLDLTAIRNRAVRVMAFAEDLDTDGSPMTGAQL